MSTVQFSHLHTQVKGGSQIFMFSRWMLSITICLQTYEWYQSSHPALSKTANISQNIRVVKFKCWMCCLSVKSVFFLMCEKLIRQGEKSFVALFSVRADTHTLNFINWCRQILKSHSLLCAKANKQFCSVNNTSAATGGRGWGGGV